MSDRRAFSLIEVLMAVGICAIALAALLALLAGLSGQTTQALERDEAHRVLAAARTLIAANSFSDVSNRLIEPGAAGAPSDFWYALRDGRFAGDTAEIVEADRFYGIVLERDVGLTDSANRLVFAIRIEWPVNLPNGATVARAERTALRFHSAKLR